MWFLLLSLDRLFYFYRHFDAFSVFAAPFQFKAENRCFESIWCTNVPHSFYHCMDKWQKFSLSIFCLTSQNGAFCNYRDEKCLDRKAHVLCVCVMYVYKYMYTVHIFEVWIDHPLRLVGHSPNCSRMQWVSIDFVCTNLNPFKVKQIENFFTMLDFRPFFTIKLMNSCSMGIPNASWLFLCFFFIHVHSCTSVTLIQLELILFHFIGVELSWIELQAEH